MVTASPPDASPAATVPDRADSLAMAGRLAGALAIPTVSHTDRGRMDARAFAALHEHLRASFPEVHRRLSVERIGERHALLYRWAGSDPALEPWLLVSHQDVVPVEPGSEGHWTHPAFGATVADGHVWGRGAIDLKASLVGALEAAERLLAEGFRPRRTVYFAFGADEEVGGDAGARPIAETLRSRGVTLAFTLDEGGVVLSGTIPGVDRPVALIGTAEKGDLKVRLVCRDAGGHSAIPPRRTAIGRLARALAAIEDRPAKARLDGPTRASLAALAAVASPAYRLVYGNLRLTAPIVRRLLQRLPEGNASLRTTAASTLIEGGLADNVIPETASAVMDLRLKPGDASQAVLARIRRKAARWGVEVETISVREASPVSATDGPGYRAIERAVGRVMPDAVAAPCLTLNGTDGYHYRPIARAQYRFVPVRMTPADLERIHGVDERIAVDNYVEVVRFFMEFVRIADR
jgi:carboxypeptidase PM20D1